MTFGLGGLHKPTTGGGGGAPSGPAGGDLGGTYPNPTVLKSRYFLRYTHGNGVPGGSTERFLRLGVGVFSSETGEVMPVAGTLIGVTFTVDTIDATRTFDAEILSDPAGKAAGPTVLGSISLPTSTLSVQTRALSVALPAGTELGARIVRTGGAGDSSFGDMVVIAEVTIP